jgi:Protein of unknown function (DUF3105)
MAQRKPPSSGKPAAKKGTSRPGGKPAGGSASATKVGTGRPGAPRKAPPRKPGKSIVNQKQTPWGMIISTVAVVLFAAAVIIVVVVTKNSGNSGSDNPYRQPELAAAKQIQGLTYKVEPDHTHVEGTIKYDSSPPVGGNHSQYWADCDGTVYTAPIANENAVHMLEHGAVWITYREGLSADKVATLAKLVTGQQYIAMSPYPNLKSAVSLQAWGYQLFVNNVDDPRITQFIATLGHNSKITPEYGASCSQPTFKAHPSTFGHPLWTPVTGAANTMSGSPAQ